MAKNIIDASLIIKHESGSGHANYVCATVEMPVSEFAAFQAIGDLTDQVPARITAYILAAGDTGTV